MTCQVIFEFRVKEACIEKLARWLREILPDTRGYEGCLTLSVTQNQDEPTSFAVIEQWETRAQYEKYLQWRTESGVLGAMTDMMEGEPSFRFFDYLHVERTACA